MHPFTSALPRSLLLPSCAPSAGARSRHRSRRRRYRERTVSPRRRDIPPAANHRRSAATGMSPPPLALPPSPGDGSDGGGRHRGGGGDVGRWCRGVAAGVRGGGGVSRSARGSVSLPPTPLLADKFPRGRSQSFWAVAGPVKLRGGRGRGGVGTFRRKGGSTLGPGGGRVRGVPGVGGARVGCWGGHRAAPRGAPTRGGGCPERRAHGVGVGGGGRVKAGGPRGLHPKFRDSLQALGVSPGVPPPRVYTGWG